MTQDKTKTQQIEEIEEMIRSTAQKHGIHAIPAYSDELEAFIMLGLIEINGVECYITPEYPRLPLWVALQYRNSLQEEIAYFVKEWHKTMNTIRNAIEEQQLERCRE